MKEYEQSQVYKKLGRNNTGLKKYYNEGSNYLLLPAINKQKNKNEKLFQTEINENSGGNSDNEQKEHDSKELKEHKYDEISHQKQGHLEG